MSVPDSMTIGIALCGIAALVLEVFGLGAGITWQNRLWGALAGLGSFALFYFGSLLVLKREGLGFGDVKLMGAAGLLLGWQNLIVSVLFASVSAVLVAGIGRLVFRRGKEAPVPAENAGQTDSAAESEAVPAAPSAESAKNAVESGENAVKPAENAVESGENAAEEEKRPFEFPFAPFLAAGIALALFFGNAVCAWYIGLFA